MQYYFFPAFAAAQRLRCASAIQARPSGLILDFFLFLVGFTGASAAAGIAASSRIRTNSFCSASIFSLMAAARRS